MKSSTFGFYLERECQSMNRFILPAVKKIKLLIFFHSHTSTHNVHVATAIMVETLKRANMIDHVDG